MEKSKDYEALINTLRMLKDEREAAFEFFYCACLNGELNICKACIDAGYDHNMNEPSYGAPILIELANDERFTPDVAEFLISNGAEIDSKYEKYDRVFQTPLGAACHCGNAKMIKYLIDKGATVTRNDLEDAIYNGHVEAVRVLLELGDVAIDNKQWVREQLLYNEYFEMLELLLKFGANPDEYGILNTAVTREEYEIAKLLLKYGADPDKYGDCYPLHNAVSKGDVKMAKLLLENGANVNIRVKNRELIKKYDGALLAMDIAIFRKDSDMQELLSQCGGTTSTRLEQLEALRSAYRR